MRQREAGAEDDLRVAPDSRADLIADAAFIAISWYDDYLDRRPIDGEIRDEADLPFPKDVLLRAFEIELGTERDPAMRAYLIERGLKLALFRPGIGARPVRRLPALRMASFPKMRQADRIALLESHHRAAEAYHRMMVEALVEMEMLEARLRRAGRAD